MVNAALVKCPSQFLQRTALVMPIKQRIMIQHILIISH